MIENLNTSKIDETFANMFSGQSTLENEKKVKTPEDKIKAESPKIESKKEVLLEKIEDEEKVDKDDLSKDFKAEYELLKKQLDETKSWGHKKNSAYVNAKKKVAEFLTKLQDDSIIDESETKLGLSFFDGSDDVEEAIVDQKENPYVQLKQTLDKEFGVFKKYNKQEDAEEKYQAFFSFLPLLSNDEQDKIINYMMNETPEVVIDHIMLTGADIYDNLYKGAEKKGGIIPFVKSLHAKVEKLEKRNKELEAELDNTEGVLHNRSINSKVSDLARTKTEDKRTVAEIKQAIFQGQK